MPRSNALLAANPPDLAVAIPVDVPLGDGGEPPAERRYDGNRYVLVDDRGPEGEWVYELLE